jgi:hypothetical protein
MRLWRVWSRGKIPTHPETRVYYFPGEGVMTVNLPSPLARPTARGCATTRLIFLAAKARGWPESHLFWTRRRGDVEKTQRRLVKSFFSLRTSATSFLRAQNGLHHKENLMLNPFLRYCFTRSYRLWQW